MAGLAFAFAALPRFNSLQAFMSSPPAPPSPSYKSAFKPSASSVDPDGGWSPELQALAAASLPDFLLEQRWYPAKDAGRPRILGADLVPVALPGTPAAA
ncbi:MAG: hypothetical protein H0T52_12270, partial [Lautropia sp.]|nr:hypothetical protein [Lautropia sp.]